MRGRSTALGAGLLAAALGLAGCTSGHGSGAAATTGASTAAASGAAAGASGAGPATAPAATTKPATPPTAAKSAVAPTPADGPATPAHTLHVATATWQLPQPLSRMVVLPAGSGLVIAGGLRNGDRSSAAVDRVDLAAGTVVAYGQLPQPVHDAAGVVLGGQPLVVGGGAAHEVGDVQTITAGAGAVVGQLPVPRSDLVTVMAGDRLVVVGGYDGARALADVLVSTDGKAYHVVAQLPVPVRYPAVLVDGDVVTVYGGDVSRRPSDVIQRIDLAKGTAVIAGHLPHPLSHESAFVLGGATWLVGGVTPSGTTSTMLRSLDGRSFTVAGSLPGPRSDAGAVVVDGTGYLVGGETRTGRVASVVTLTPAG